MVNLRTYRKSQGLSQKDMAVALGVTQSMISKIENGDVRPGPSLMFEIEDATKGAVPARSWVGQQEATQ